MARLLDPKLARDSFYVSVGFGVLGFQKLQVRRRELEREWAKQRRGALDEGGTLLPLLQPVVDLADDVVDGALALVAVHAPSPIRPVARGVRAAHHEHRDQVRGLFGQPAQR